MCASQPYTLGYYPENKKYDGKYRSIKVKVNQSGAEVFNRRGYYAIDLSQIKGNSPSQEVALALANSTPTTQVSFTARVVPPDTNAVKGKLGISSGGCRHPLPGRGFRGHETERAFLHGGLFGGRQDDHQRE
jgi:hypothetical protein